MPEITLLRDKVNASRQQLEDLKRVVSEEQARLVEL
jgi:hypothetical protein